MRSRRNNKQPAYKPGTRWIGSIQTHIVRSMYSTILFAASLVAPVQKVQRTYVLFPPTRVAFNTAEPRRPRLVLGRIHFNAGAGTLELGRRRLVELPRPMCLQSAAHDAELRNCGHNIRHPRLHPSRHVRNLRGGKRGGGCPVFCE